MTPVSLLRVALGFVAVGLNLTLLAVMVILLATGMLISQSLFEFMAVGGPTGRDMPILAVYWALVIRSIHLGLHWPIVMGIARKPRIYK